MNTKNPMTEEEAKIRSRVALLCSELDANEEESRAMQGELDTLYAKLDAMKTKTS